MIGSALAHKRTQEKVQTLDDIQQKKQIHEGEDQAIEADRLPHDQFTHGARFKDPNNHYDRIADRLCPTPLGGGFRQENIPVRVRDPCCLDDFLLGEIQRKLVESPHFVSCEIVNGSFGRFEHCPSFVSGPILSMKHA